MTPEIQITHQGLKYTCRGNGLRRSGCYFQADLTPYLPVLFKNGKVKKGETTSKSKQSPDWWRAQCTFRGLPHKGTLPELHDRLRSGPNIMAKELVELETKANTEWKAKNDVVEQEEERKQEIQQRKKEEDAMRFLRNIFQGDEKAPDAIVLKKDWWSFRGAATSLRLHFIIIRAPIVSLSNDYDFDWIIVGTNKGAVNAKVSNIRKEADDWIAAREKREEAEAQAKRDAIAQKHAVIAKSSSKGGVWDVTGTWRITCGEIESGWNVEELTLKIYRINEEANSQMFAEFDFGIISGWFRFEGLAVKKASGTQKGAMAGQKRKWADEDTDSEESDEEEVNEAFYLSSKGEPSPKQPKWNYRWRGIETGEGEIQIGSDERLNPVTFSGQGGAKLSGFFECEYLSKCEFSGIKIEVGDPRKASNISIKEKWKDLNERAYERARAGRWH